MEARELFSSCADKRLPGVVRRQVVRHALAHGIGCASVPASGQHLRPENVVFRPLWRADALADIHLCWREDSRDPAAATLRRLVPERWKPPAALRVR